MKKHTDPVNEKLEKLITDDHTIICVNDSFDDKILITAIYTN